MENQESFATRDIHNFLERRLGDKEAREVMNYIHSEISRNVEEQVRTITEEADKWRAGLKNDFATKEDGVELRKKLVKRVSAVEGTIILWGFVFWATLILAFYIITRLVK